MEVDGRCLIEGTFPTYAWKEWGKAQRPYFDTRTQGRDLNSRLPGYKEVITSQLRRSVV